MLGRLRCQHKQCRTNDPQPEEATSPLHCSNLLAKPRPRLLPVVVIEPSGQQLNLGHGHHHQQPQQQGHYDKLEPFRGSVREPSQHFVEATKWAPPANRTGYSRSGGRIIARSEEVVG